MHMLDAFFIEPFLQLGGADKFGFAPFVVADADGVKSDRCAYAGAHGFGEGFFGGKTLGQHFHRPADARPIVHFQRA